MEINQAPVARASMLIRKPAGEVIEALINPQITTKFWFTWGSARLTPGAMVKWDWEMFGSSVMVNVLAVDPDKRILFEWTAGGAPTTVEWLFTKRPDKTTFVQVTNSGFKGDGDEVVQQALAATEGFTIVLAGLKAFLEHHVVLNLVADKFPEGLPQK
jgi:uncharacterized protein YndB with AHSA1/START domain